MSNAALLLRFRTIMCFVSLLLGDKASLVIQAYSREFVV